MICSANALAVVDDNVEFAVSFGQGLELLGCEVRLAQDHSTALMRAVFQRPQLVFMDLNLGPEHGSEVMTGLRRMLLEDVGMTIVCLTSDNRPDTELRCRKAGFDLYLLKPIANNVLNEVLDACRERTSCCLGAHMHARSERSATASLGR